MDPTSLSNQGQYDTCPTPLFFPPYINPSLSFSSFDLHCFTITMEISVEKVEGSTDVDYFYDSYTVHVGNHRILTVVTYCEITAVKWLKQAKKVNNSKSLPKTLVVGFSVERQNDYYSRYGLLKFPYELLHICIGSHCLLYHLDDPEFNKPPKFLAHFLADPKVIVVGMGIKDKASHLEKDFEVKIKNAVDLNELAVKGMKRDELDLGRYDLDRLAKAVLGKHMDVVRPGRKIEWFKGKRPYYHSPELSNEKVMFTTADAYLCYSVGSQLFDMIHGKASSAIAAAAAVAAAAKSRKNKKMKKGKKNKKGKK